MQYTHRILLILLVTIVPGCGALDKTKDTFDAKDKVEVNTEKGDKGDSGESIKGDPGKNGVDAEPCKIISSNKGHTITCGEQTIYLTKNEENEGCSVVPKEDGYTITCGDTSVDVNTTTRVGPKGDQGSPGSDGKNGRDAEPCELLDTPTGYTITCNGKTIAVDTTHPENSKPTRLKICIWDTWYSIKTVMAKIKDINNEVYDIAHIGQCLFEGKVADHQN